MFFIRDEPAQYAICYQGYYGTAGDQLSSNHRGMKFSTADQDNDRGAANCADDNGPWWHNNCDSCNLNGKKYGQAVKDDYGNEWGDTLSMKESAMRIRPTYSDELDWIE